MSKIKISDLMSKSNVKFGTSGARGLVENMTDEVCFCYATAFAMVLNLKPGQAVGIAVDLRPSSPRIASACIAALNALGIKSHYFGYIPTPALAYYAEQNNMPAIMVTGSHIPFDRNGIKFYSETGEITKAHEEGITNAAFEYSLPTFDHSLPEINILAKEAYINRYLTFLKPNYFEGLKLGFYQHSSVGRDLITDLFEKLGANVIALGRTDEFTPIDTEAVATVDIERAQNWANQHGFDAIISTDGDGDRPLIGDELGNWLRGDIVGLLTSEFLNIDAIATPVSCNTAIEKSNLFKKVVRTRIGSPYVIQGIEALINDGFTSVAGFEANGGYLLGSAIENSAGALKALCTRDAVLPIIAILALATEKRCKVSQLTSHLPNRITASDRIKDFATEKSKAIINHFVNDQAALTQFLKADFGGFKEIDTTDGLRITLNNEDIVHFRPSGNAPELRCYAESSTVKHAQHLVKQALESIQTVAI